jgi:hypothetical protein
VLNGPSYGPGYLLILAEGLTHACSDPSELGNAIARFLGT